MKAIHVAYGIGIGALLLLLAAGAVSAQTDPPANGDWTVADDTTIKDQTITLYDGSLAVTSTGNLTLDNCELYFDFGGAGTGQIGITVERGGSLTAKKTTITSYDEPNNRDHYFFVVYGKLDLDKCRVAEAYGHYCSTAGDDHYLTAGGIELMGAKATLTNTTIENNMACGLFIEDCGPVVTDCIITNNSRDEYDNPTGIMTHNATPKLTRCTISGNGVMSWNSYYYSWTDQVYNSTSCWGVGISSYDSKLEMDYCDVYGNGRGEQQLGYCAVEYFYNPAHGWANYYVQHDFHSSGTGISETQSSSTITNCRVFKNGGTGISLDNSDTAIKGCTISNNTRLSTWGNFNSRLPNPSASCYVEIFGVGVYSNSGCEVKDCTIEWNGKWLIGEEGAHEVQVDNYLASVYHYYYNQTPTDPASNSGIALDGGNNPNLRGKNTIGIERSNILDNGVAGIFSYNVPAADILSNRIERNGVVVDQVNWQEARGYGIYIMADMGGGGERSADRGLLWTVKDTIIAGNGHGSTGFYYEDSAGIRVERYPLQVVNCTISRHSTGIHLDSCPLQLTQANIDGNYYYGLMANRGNVEVRGSQLQGNETAAFLQQQCDLEAWNCKLTAPDTGDMEDYNNSLLVAGSASVFLQNCTLSGSNHMWLKYGSVKCVNTTLNVSRCNLTYRSSLSLSWYVDINLVWQNDVGVDLANLTVSPGAPGGTKFSGQVRDGWLRGIVVLDRLYSNTAGEPPVKVAYGPYTFNATRGPLWTALTKDVDRSSVFKLKLIDPKAPHVGISKPLQGELFNHSYILAQGNASDEDSGLALVEVSLDNSTWTSAGGLDPWNWMAMLNDSTYTLHVRATDVAGLVSFAAVSFTVDTHPPLVEFVSPDEGFLTNLTNVTLVVDVGDAVHAEVNGLNASITGGRISVVVDLTEGFNVFTVKARDEAGNWASATRNITSDTIPPVLTVLYPMNGTTVATPAVTLTGLTEFGAVVHVNGAAVPAPGVYFQTPLNLTEGANDIEVTARDAAGNVARVTLTIILDTTPPVLNVTAPADGTLTNQVSCLLAGTTEPGATVRVNGIQVTVTNGSFQLTLQLAEGLNTLIVSAADAVGNLRTLTLNVTLDTIPPALFITSPLDKAKLNTTGFTVVGTVEAGASLAVNGAVVSATGTTFRVDLTGTEGWFNITATARDAANNTRTVTLTVLIDLTKPAVTEIGPFGDQTSTKTGKDSATVTGKTEPGAKVTVNDVTVYADASGAFSATIPLKPGKNAVTLMVTDSSGNTQRRDFTIERTPAKTAEGGGLPAIFILGAIVLGALAFTGGMLMGRSSGRGGGGPVGALGGRDGKREKDYELKPSGPENEPEKPSGKDSQLPDKEDSPEEDDKKKDEAAEEDDEEEDDEEDDDEDAGDEEPEGEEEKEEFKP